MLSSYIKDRLNVGYDTAVELHSEYNRERKPNPSTHETLTGRRGRGGEGGRVDSMLCLEFEHNQDLRNSCMNDNRLVYSAV